MIYLDNAATSHPKPFAVKKAVWNALSHSVNVGRNSSRLSFYYADKILSVRENIGKLLGIFNVENIVFTMNASYGLNFALKGFLPDGGEVVTTATEHNSVLRQLCSNSKYRLTLLPSQKDNTPDFRKLPKCEIPYQGLLIVNVASNVTGRILPYREIYQKANQSGWTLLFDFSQAIGNIDVNLSKMNHTMAVFSGHKSLLGPQGTGVLYVSEDISLSPVLEGGTGSLSNDFHQPDFLPDQFEVGTLNTPGILGLGEGIQFVLQETPAKLLSHKRELCKLVYEKLRQIPTIKLYHGGNFSDYVGILSFNIGSLYSEEVASLLSKEYGISTRGGFHCAPLMHRELGTNAQGTVRISPGYCTTKKEIRKFIDAIYRISKNYAL
ncbi:MAG: aminotransferase class V-fold PLP-dependent enzyme [Ruminococcaceae bacterium]|nr:aminotransferase class V-fold PLP-dependent enzyme [Oscillospiraceae bacterium]